MKCIVLVMALLCIFQTQSYAACEKDREVGDSTRITINLCASVNSHFDSQRNVDPDLAEELMFNQECFLIHPDESIELISCEEFDNDTWVEE